MLFGLQQVHGEGRHQGTGQDVRRDHGKDDRFGQRNKKILRYAAQEEHGQEDDTDAQCRHQGRHGNLRGSIQDAVVKRGTPFQVTLDILNGDGRIVDQDAHGERETAERHDVDRLAQEAKNDHRGKD